MQQRARRRSWARTCAWAALLLLARSASAELPESGYDPAEVRERTELLGRIFRGQEVDASVRAFRALLDRRERRAATAKAAQDAIAARQASNTAYKTSLDYAASWYCRLSPSPLEPRSDHYQAADWGRVARKFDVAAANPDSVRLDEQPLWGYEIVGVRERYFVSTADNPALKAEVGELVFLCCHGKRTHAEFAPPWNKIPFTSAKYSGRLTELPRIAGKTKWNPIHITGAELRHAISDRSWPIPAGRQVVALLRVEKDLGGGRYAMRSPPWDDALVVEVPPGVPRRELLLPEAYVWIIMGSPRFDRFNNDQKQLVLVAADLESRYLIE